MSSQRRKIASRANGARSLGPKTPAGRRRSALNATRHGLLARCVLLSGESPEAFQAMLAEYLGRFVPGDGVECGFIEEMAAAFWRLRRTWAIETRLMDDSINSQSPGDPIERLTAAFSALASTPQLNLLHRYETRLHRMFQRSLHNLLLLRQQESPDEPGPAIPGRGASPPDSPSPPVPAPEAGPC